MKTEDIIKKIPELKLEPKTTKKHYLFMYSRKRRYYSLQDACYEEHPAAEHVFFYIDTSRKSTTQYEERIYYEYIPEIESVVCMLCKIDTRVPIVEEPINWKIIDYFFITKSKELITQYNDKWHVITEDIVSALPFSLLLNGIDYEQYNDPNLPNNNLYEAFQHLFPVVYLKGSTSVVLNSVPVLLDFLSHKEQKKRTGPKQQLIDDLTSIELEPIDPAEYIDIATECNKRSNFKRVMSYAKISKVKDNVCCIRYILKDCTTKDITEGIRIYVDGKTAIACKKNNSNEYVQLRLNAGKENYQATMIIPFEQEIVDGTLLQYFGSIFKEIKPAHQSMAIWAFLQYPLLEKLYKLGLKDLVKSSFSRWNGNPTVVINDAIGIVDIKNKNLYKALGINRYQFTKLQGILTESYTGFNIIKKIKEILTGDNEAIDAIDNNTFDILFDNLLEFYRSNKNSQRYAYISALYLLNKIYSTKTMLNMCNDVLQMYIDSENTWHTSNNYIRMYNDYLTMVNTLQDNKNYRPKYDSYNDIREMHDAALAVYNLKKEELHLEAFKKQAKKWEKFIYEGKEFSVIAPKHPGEIAYEGITLHHCVKSYIGRIIDGSTNIVFIRKNDDLSKPFFTVEISNSGKIEQIHGFANRNMNTETGLEDFVTEWAKANKLSITNVNKVR